MTDEQGRAIAEAITKGAGAYISAHGLTGKLDYGQVAEKIRELARVRIPALVKEHSENLANTVGMEQVVVVSFHVDLVQIGIDAVKAVA